MFCLLFGYTIPNEDKDVKGQDRRQARSLQMNLNFAGAGSAQGTIPTEEPQFRWGRIGTRHDPYGRTPISLGQDRRQARSLRKNLNFAGAGSAQGTIPMEEPPFRRDTGSAQGTIPTAPVRAAGGRYGVTRCVRVCHHLSDRGKAIDSNKRGNRLPVARGGSAPGTTPTALCPRDGGRCVRNGSQRTLHPPLGQGRAQSLR
jgi:hypothetical protein